MRLGPPVGALTLDGTCTRDLLLVAGSTGLAPLKAIVEQVAALEDPPQVDLFFGAATAEGLYDLDALDKLAARHRWLAVTPVITGRQRRPRVFRADRDPARGGGPVG